ncbi:hypothetical protein YC2023_013058 [Brassica napus]
MAKGGKICHMYERVVKFYAFPASLDSARLIHINYLAKSIPCMRKAKDHQKGWILCHNNDKTDLLAKETTYGNSAYEKLLKHIWDFPNVFDTYSRLELVFNMSDLPCDLIEEILCRVPATSLRHLRSTCKQWNLLFNEMNFSRVQCFKSK